MALQNAIADRMTFGIINNTDAAITLALATGHLPVDGILMNDSKAYPHRHDVSRLESLGFPGIDCILDDATPAEADGFSIAGQAAKVQIMATDRSQSLRAQKEVLDRSWRYIKSITLTTNDQNFFEQGLISFGTFNPFHKDSPRDVNLSRYFSVNQYQQGKIVIDYANGEVQWNDDLIFLLKGIPSKVEDKATTVNVIIEFYSE